VPSIENDLESGLPDISAKGKQGPTTQASQEASTTIMSLGVTTQEQRDEYEKDTLLAFDQQEQVVDPYKLSSFKFYMCVIIFLKLALYIVYAFTLNGQLSIIGIIIVTPLVAAPSYFSSVWQFFGLLRACATAGLNRVRNYFSWVEGVSS